MNENFTERMSRPPQRQEEFKSVTNFDELNKTLAAFHARLTMFETDMYKRMWEQMQNEADHDALLRRHNGLVKTHDENVRDVECEMDALEAKINELRADCDEGFKAALKVFKFTWDEIESLNEGEDFLLSKVSPAQMEFRDRLRDILYKKSLPKD